MADLSAIKLPNGTTYNLKDKGALPLTGGAVTGPVSFGDSVSIDDATIGSLVVNGNASFANGVKASSYNGGQPTYTVIGTQTAATGAWTGNIDAPALYDGMRILYYLPYAGSGNATLNLTLSDGTTTGAVNCYLYANSRLTTHYGAGYNFHLTYWSAGSIKINGTATTDDRWIVDSQYWSNTVSQLRHDYSVVYAGAAGIFPYTLIMMNKDGNYESIVTSSSTGTSKAKNTAGFLPGRLLLYYASGTTTNGNKITASNYGLYEGYSAFDARYSFNISTTGLTVGKPVYLVGTISNGLFYLADTWWTQTLPTSADGKVYMYVGQVYMPASTTSDYRVNIVPYHPIYQYTNGALRLYGGDVAWGNVSGKPTATGSKATGISIGNHATGTVIGVQSSTTTASKATAGTAVSIPNVTSAGSASNWVFENITVPKAASATACDDITSWSAGSGSASLTMAIDSSDSKKLNITFSHTHTAPTLQYTARSIAGVSGSVTASHVKSGGNGTAPTLGTAISITPYTFSDVTVPIKNTSASTFVTGTTHTVTDNGHTHSIS